MLLIRFELAGCKVIVTIDQIYKHNKSLQLIQQYAVSPGSTQYFRSTEHKIPVNELKHGISLSLTYHAIKHLPGLGV